MLKRLEQRPLSIAGDFRRGRTPFDRLDVALRIADGIASVEDVTARGRRDPPRARRLGIDPDARPRPEGHRRAGVGGADAAPVFELPFVVQGPWDDPIMLPDAQSLIRRSGAAAPLLDAVRDRKTRDAVRSVIDRLSRDGMAPAAASSEPGRRLPQA